MKFNLALHNGRWYDLKNHNISFCWKVLADLGVVGSHDYILSVRKNKQKGYQAVTLTKRDGFLPMWCWQIEGYNAHDMNVFLGGDIDILITKIAGRKRKLTLYFKFQRKKS